MSSLLTTTPLCPEKQTGFHHSTLRPSQMPGENVTDGPKEAILKSSYDSITDLLKVFSYLIITKPVVTQKHTLSDDLSL